MPLPKRVQERVASRLRHFQNILTAQRSRDVSEADTVTVVKDLLAELFGYDKYSEVTSEHSIRGTFCDLAVHLDGKLGFLIEVKAVGIELKDAHVKQAVDYAANQGCEWVVLTNGILWRLYHVLFKKPVDKQEVISFDLLSLSHRADDDLETLYVLTREGFTKSAMTEFRDRRDATSRYMLAAIILCSETVRMAVRREVRRISDINIDADTIEKMLRAEVIKREAVEGDAADAAKRRVCRSEKMIRKTPDRQGEPAADAQSAVTPTSSSAVANT